MWLRIVLLMAGVACVGFHCKNGTQPEGTPCQGDTECPQGQFCDVDGKCKKPASTDVDGSDGADGGTDPDQDSNTDQPSDTGTCGLCA